MRALHSMGCRARGHVQQGGAVGTPGVRPGSCPDPKRIFQDLPAADPLPLPMPVHCRENLEMDFLPWMSQKLTVADMYHLLDSLSKARPQKYLSLVLIKSNKVYVIPLSAHPMSLTSNRVRGVQGGGGGGTARRGQGGGPAPASTCTRTSLRVRVYLSSGVYVLRVGGSVPSRSTGQSGGRRAGGCAICAVADERHPGGAHGLGGDPELRGHAVHHERMGRAALRLA